MTLRSEVLRRCCLLYLALPTVIFMLGWLRWEIGVPAALLVVVAVLKMLRRHGGGKTVEPLLASDAEVKVPVSTAFALVVCLVAWCVMSGQGGFVPQSADWHWRNALFRDLLTHEWPVTYPARNESLVFYAGHWLPSALVAKGLLALGLDAASARNVGKMALLVWTCLGVSIVFLRYAVFVVCEVGLYFVVTWRHFRQSVWWWMTLIVLLVCPLVAIGHGSDFSMRVSVPAMLVLLLMTLYSMFEYWKERRAASIAIGFLLVLGTCVSFANFEIVVLNPRDEQFGERDGIISFGGDVAGATKDMPSHHKNFCCSNPANHFFYKWMAKREGAP